jgi:phosphate uptake regulator
MNLATELAQCDPHNTPPEILAASLTKWIEQAKKEAEQIKKDAEQIAQQHADIRSKEARIAALAYELAWHKRLKFAAKSEAFNA